MNGFLGTYYVNLDEKGRLNVPAKFRAVLEKDHNPSLVACMMDDFLIVFPQQEWEANETKMSQLSAFAREDRNRLRDFYSRSDNCEMKSGKILVPSNLRKLSGLSKEAVLVGMSRTFEIWDMARWEKTYPSVQPETEV